MPWCPKCGNEYEEGVRECSECKVALVNEYPEKLSMKLLVTIESESNADKLTDYLKYSGIDSVTELNDDNEYDIYVPKKKFHKAEEAFKGFYIATKQEEQLKEIKERLDEKGVDLDDVKLKNKGKDEADWGIDSEEEEAGEDVSIEDALLSGVTEANDIVKLVDADEETKKAIQEAVSATLSDEEDDLKVSIKAKKQYESKDDKYKDYESTFYTFTIFGVVGLIAVVLQLSGVYKFLNPISLGVMGVLFLGFVVVGIEAKIKMGKLKGEAKAEREKEKEFKSYLDEALDESMLKSFDRHDSIELNYMDETAGIKKMLMAKFGEDLEGDYLDRFVEAYYDNRFDNN